MLIKLIFTQSSRGGLENMKFKDYKWIFREVFNNKKKPMMDVLIRERKKSQAKKSRFQPYCVEQNTFILCYVWICKKFMLFFFVCLMFIRQINNRIKKKTIYTKQ